MKQTTSRPEPFSWLFIAHFDDGSVIEQTQADASVTGKGSAFTDVVNKEGLVAFELAHVDGQQQVLVDLTTGTFVVNGTPMVVHADTFDPERYDLRLVYFRETQIDQHLDAEGNSTSVDHYVRRYFVGWQTTDAKGKNVQHTIGVA